MIIFRQNSGYGQSLLKSKSWLVVPFGTVGDGGKHCFCIRGCKSPVTMIVLLLFTLECIHMLLSTWYKNNGGWLSDCHCSFFPEKRIPISEISAVEVTVMPVSSYALSLDRLIIYKGDTQWLLISPVNKQDFVKLLKKHNPDIRIKEPVI